MSYKPLPNFLTIKASSIHGLGLFAVSKIKKNTMIGITHVLNQEFENNYIRTPLGGFINHSNNPNCELRVSNGIYLTLCSTNEIQEEEEITLKYKMYADFL